MTYIHTYVKAQYTMINELCINIYKKNIKPTSLHKHSQGFLQAPAGMVLLVLHSGYGAHSSQLGPCHPALQMHVSGSLSIQIHVAGSLSIQIHVAGSLSRQIHGDGSLSRQIQVAGSPNIQIHSAGSLNIQIPVASSLSKQIHVAGSLNIQIHVVGFPKHTY